MTTTDTSTPTTSADTPHPIGGETADLIEQEVEATAGRFIDMLANAAFVSMVAVGDRLGLYEALANSGDATARELAQTTGCNERLLLEWLSSNASAGFLVHVVDDDGDDRFIMNAPAAAVLGDDNSPAFLASAAGLVRSYFTDQDQLAAAFAGSGGIDWADHHECMFTGVERFYGAAYAGNLITEWIPSVRGLEAKLMTGARVADVGCGHGVSTALMAAAFPQSTFHGLDFHDHSVTRARQLATERGVQENTAFDVRAAADYDDGPYDVICFFDALHDMGDPAAAIANARKNLTDDGVILLVENQSGDDRAGSIAHPMGALFYAASTVLCTPCALAQDGPEALGNQVGTARWEKFFVSNGFSRFECALSTPLNLILTARP